uniref:Uncharacterized protein n=1 Tax=Aplanochytrium stocchinoi TaxID=215587 RepID=A0A7S3PI48_9STRA|mmetsp:Transcript_28871/g.35538  ORF Transcript_28871/g.35538 Transcript_28871/m.35538 type:complete len:321 (+) Transcript_28871:1376-2338(+)
MKVRINTISMKAAALLSLCICLTLSGCNCMADSSSSGSGCVSLVDSTLHFPKHSVSADESLSLTLEDVGVIVSRELGVEAYVNFGTENGKNSVTVLPTGDIFIRPKAALAIYIENISLDSIEKIGQEQLPRLFQMFVSSETAFTLHDSEAEDDVSMPAMYSLGAHFPNSVVRVANSEGNAFENFHEILSSVKSNLVQDNDPDLYIFTLSPTQNMDIEEMQSLEIGLVKLLQRFDTLYEGRTSKTVVLLGGGKKSPTPGRRVLQTGTEQPGFEGADHILMVWTCVVLLLVLFLLFCCVNWTSEMDPILTSGFKTGSHTKRE